MLNCKFHRQVSIVIDELLLLVLVLSVEPALTGCASAVACFSYSKVDDKPSSDSADASDDVR